MSTIIKIENLSKNYIIGHQKQERYTALRDVMMHKLRGIGQRLRHPLSPNKEVTNLEEFWALKDINLEIKQGDRVGIIDYGELIALGTPAELMVEHEVKDLESVFLNITGRRIAEGS